MCDAKQIYLLLDNALPPILSRVKETEDFFIAEINGNDKMSKKHSKYITVRDYTDNTLLVLSGTASGVSLLSFTTIIAMPVGIASTSISLVFLIINGIVKIFLKQWERKEKKISLLVRSKLNGIEKMISKAPIDSGSSHKELTLVINKEQFYHRLKESIRIKDIQPDAVERY